MQQVSKLPSKLQLITQLAYALKQPSTKLTRTLKAAPTKLTRAIKLSFAPDEEEAGADSGAAEEPAAE